VLHDEEKLLRLKQQNSKQAISLAMEGRWREAVELNREILENYPDDVDAYNRLGRAHMERGEYARAREAYNRAVELEPYNAIAKKNLNRLNYLKEETTVAVDDPGSVAPHHFIEEMGKAGVINLYQLAPQEALARMVAGDTVHLKPQGSSLIAENRWGEYLGQVDPRHTPRLIRLMAGGNKYSAAVVSSGEGSMAVMIREIYQDPGQVGRVSFPPKGQGEFRSYIGDRSAATEAEQEDETGGESGYTIIGGSDIEVLADDDSDVDENEDDNED
ncbi:tetratricopeptide repeat protein, partial [Chloroflexota bacterium]